jgi:hypothetical protein
MASGMGRDTGAKLDWKLWAVLTQWRAALDGSGRGGGCSGRRMTGGTSGGGGGAKQVTEDQEGEGKAQVVD